MASFPDASIHLCVFLLIVFASGGPVYGANFLLTGQTLGPGEMLSYELLGGDTFLMQNDCNLVLWQHSENAIWKSNSTCPGCNSCNLSFTDNGQLVIRDRSGRQRWITSNKKSEVGKYIAVLTEGQVAIYGPKIWSVGPDKERISTNNNEMMSSTGIIRIFYNNVLFSSHALHDNDKLFNNGYSFILEDCELSLKDSNGEILWRTWTRGYGKNCFATLDFRGELFIRNGTNERIWSNEVRSKLGDYVLVVQQNGNVVIYGPKVWSTRDLASEFLQMAAAKK